MRPSGSIGAALGVALGCGWIALGCAGETEGGVPTVSRPSTVIAEDRLGPITLGDVDRFLLDLPPEQRWQPETEMARWYATLTRRLAVDRLLLEEATLLGSDQDPELRQRERRILRRAYSEAFLDELFAGEEPVPEADLRAHYEANRSRFDRQERREVFHLFKRFSGAGRASVLGTMAGLRARAAAGESFELLAREHSDSETRHEGGRLGFVPRGRFPEDFDRVVFGLEPGLPSEVVKTADGAHLFLVAGVLEARSFAFDEVRRLILQELEAERRRGRLAAASQGIALPEESYLPGREEVVRILRNGDRGAAVLRIGSFRLTAGELEGEIQERLRLLGRRREADLPWQLLQEIRHREVLYQHLVREGLPEIPPERLERERRRQLIDHYGRQKMISFLERHPEWIRAHHARNAMRFTTPLRVEVRRLEVPHGGNASATMGRLEAARRELDAGGLGLEALADSLGGGVRELGLVTATQLMAIDPRALRFVFALKPGEHSPPYQAGGELILFQVVSRQEPVPLPLARVRERVVQDYLTHNAARVFSELSDGLLAEAGFKLYADRLSEVGPIVAAVG